MTLERILEQVETAKQQGHKECVISGIIPSEVYEELQQVHWVKQYGFKFMDKKRAIIKLPTPREDEFAYIEKVIVEAQEQNRDSCIITGTLSRQAYLLFSEIYSVRQYGMFNTLEGPFAIIKF